MHNFSILSLLGWTVFICIRAIDTTNSCFGAKYGAATGALIENDSSIGRHLLGFGKPALWTGYGDI
jgi:hypothetical protein